jgi:hypothetical protein
VTPVTPIPRVHPQPVTNPTPTAGSSSSAGPAMYESGSARTASSATPSRSMISTLYGSRTLRATHLLVATDPPPALTQERKKPVASGMTTGAQTTAPVACMAISAPNADLQTTKAATAQHPRRNDHFERYRPRYSRNLVWDSKYTPHICSALATETARLDDIIYNSPYLLSLILRHLPYLEVTHFRAPPGKHTI